MAKKKTDDTTDTTGPSAEDEAMLDATVTAAQEAMDAEHERGYRGVAVDPTPNEHYTVAGVTAGKPTPETDPEHRRAVRAEIEDRAAGRA